MVSAALPVVQKYISHISHVRVQSAHSHTLSGHCYSLIVVPPGMVSLRFPIEKDIDIVYEIGM
jgi:hypothetical protein